METFDSSAMPWIPLGPGESFKPLAFLPNCRVLLLRVEPGTIIPRHRHLGAVHAFNVSGWRRLDTGEMVGPGAFVYEPAGNVDSWQAVGDEPAIVHIASFGPMEYLADDDRVLRRDDGSTLHDAYVRYCQEQNR